MPCVPQKNQIIAGGYSPVHKVSLFFMFVEHPQVCSLDLHMYLEDSFGLPLPSTNKTHETDHNGIGYHAVWLLSIVYNNWEPNIPPAPAES